MEMRCSCFAGISFLFAFCCDFAIACLESNHTTTPAFKQRKRRVSLLRARLFARVNFHAYKSLIQQQCAVSMHGFRALSSRSSPLVDFGSSSSRLFLSDARLIHHLGDQYVRPEAASLRLDDPITCREAQLLTFPKDCSGSPSRSIDTNFSAFLLNKFGRAESPGPGGERV